MRVAIVHDDLTQRGGAERVVLSLHRMFPDAPVLTSVYDPEGTHPSFAECDVRTTFMQRLPHRGAAARALLPVYPFAFERMDLSGYDLVISSSSRFAHGVSVPDGRHVVYCYSPARWLYLPESYFQTGSPVPSWARPLLPPVLDRIRRWDQRVAARPDLYVGISSAIAERISRIYGRAEVPVVFPPVDTTRIEAGVAALRSDAAFDADERRRHAIPAEPYFLAVARLLPYKRVDLAASACAAMGRKLVVVGDGPALEEVWAAAGTSLEVRPSVGDAELECLIAHATAVIQAGEEDFGLVPLEANAAGRPAVAFGALGALETVRDGVTGVLFAEQSIDALVEALGRAESTEWDVDVLIAHARSFSEERFHAQLRPHLLPT